MASVNAASTATIATTRSADQLTRAATDDGQSSSFNAILAAHRDAVTPPPRTSASARADGAEKSNDKSADDATDESVEKTPADDGAANAQPVAPSDAQSVPNQPPPEPARSLPTPATTAALMTQAAQASAALGLAAVSAPMAVTGAKVATKADDKTAASADLSHAGTIRALAATVTAAPTAVAPDSGIVATPSSVHETAAPTGGPINRTDLRSLVNTVGANANAADAASMATAAANADTFAAQLADQLTAGLVAATTDANPTAPMVANATLTAATSPAGVYTVSTPVDHPSWSHDLAAVVSISVRDKVQEAEIRIEPRDLGPIVMRLRIEGELADISFVAMHAETRTALDNGMQRLRETLAGSGIELGQTSVSAGQRGHEQFTGRPSTPGTPNSPDRSLDAATDGVPTAIINVRGAGSRLIDTFA